MSYDTRFKVKYNDIEQELLFKMKNEKEDKNEEEDKNEKEDKNEEDDKNEKEDKNEEEDYVYSTEDVLDICAKLYRDEFLTVFGADDVMSDKIDNGLKYVYNNMIVNEQFKKILDEMSEIFYNDGHNKESVYQLVLLSLFSQNVFYITHKCICQQMNTRTIDNDLLVELRNKSILLIKNQFTVN